MPSKLLWRYLGKTRKMIFSGIFSEVKAAPVIILNSTFRSIFFQPYFQIVFYRKRAQLPLILQWIAPDNRMLIRSKIKPDWCPNTAGIYQLKVNERNIRTRAHSGVFAFNFEHISHLVLVFLLLTLNM